MEENELLKKLKQHWKKFLAALNRPLDLKFPKTEHKQLFLFFMGVLEVALLWFIAHIHVGVWQGDSSIAGLLAGYIRSDRSYPWWLFVGLSALLWACIYVALSREYGGNTGRGFDISESNVYGSARDINMEELEEITKIGPKNAVTGTIYGQLDETEEKLITSKPIDNFNKNILCLAPPGSGKTATIVINYITQAILRGESVVTTDTKGEVFAKTVELARLHGYTIRRFDLKNHKCSDGWDILSEIRKDSIRAEIAANAIMSNTGNPKDTFYAPQQALLTGLCLAMELDDEIPQEEKTFYNATSANLFQGAAKLDEKFNDYIDDPKMRVAYDYYATSIQGSPNLRGNVVSGLLSRLSIFSNPHVKEMTSTPDIDLTLPGTQKCIYYVVLPDQHNSMKLLSSLFFSFLFLDLCDLADERDDQKLPVPVNVMIEEAFACGSLPTISNALATVRSRDIGICMIAQGIDQLEILYEEKMTNSILECCSTYACLGTNTKSTASLFSWLSGVATVKVKTEQHSVGEGPFSWGRAYSTGDGRQELYSENDIRKMKFRRVLLIFQRYDPLMAHTFYYKNHPEYKKKHMPEVNAYTHIPLADKEARARFRAEEEERIMRYDAWRARGGDPFPGYTFDKPYLKGMPKCDEPIPAIIPYKDLEELALKHSEQAQVGKAQIMSKLQGAPVFSFSEAEDDEEAETEQDPYDGGEPEKEAPPSDNKKQEPTPANQPEPAPAAPERVWPEMKAPGEGKKAYTLDNPTQTDYQEDELSSLYGTPNDTVFSFHHTKERHDLKDDFLKGAETIKVNLPDKS